MTTPTPRLKKLLLACTACAGTGKRGGVSSRPGRVYKQVSCAACSGTGIGGYTMIEVG